MVSFFGYLNRVAEASSHWFLLAVRLFWGIQFAFAGWGKLENIGSTISFFQNLGIPFAEYQAPLVAYVEFVGGILLAIGLLSRLVSIPLIITMLVALFLTRTGFLSDPMSVTQDDAFHYLIACLIIFCFGAGKFSLDYLIRK